MSACPRVGESLGRAFCSLDASTCAHARLFATVVKRKGPSSCSAWSPSKRLGSKMHDPATGCAAAFDLTAPTAPQVIRISARRHPADASLAAFVDRLTLLQPGDGGMNHCRPNQGRQVQTRVPPPGPSWSRRRLSNRKRSQSKRELDIRHMFA